MTEELEILYDKERTKLMPPQMVKAIGKKRANKGWPYVVVDGKRFHFCIDGIMMMVGWMDGYGPIELELKGKKTYWIYNDDWQEFSDDPDRRHPKNVRP